MWKPSVQTVLFILTTCFSSENLEPWYVPGRECLCGQLPPKSWEKVGLKLNIQKTKIVASTTITSWQIDGETVETVIDFILWGSKITADGDCSHEIKRRLLLRRKVMTNLNSILLTLKVYKIISLLMNRI